MLRAMPANEDELADMMFTATHIAHATFIRYPRGAAEGVPIKEQPELLEIGKAQVVRHFSNNGRKKIALFGLGPMNTIARQAAAQLAEEGFDAAVINPRFTKPLDAGTHEFFGRGADMIVTLEDHALMGGYGSAMLELFSEKNIVTPVVRIGWPDQFIEHASSVDELRHKYGLTAGNVVARVKAHFGETAVATPKLIDVA
ncbi:MAG TPA: transketolase C-terminal domain-containing protein, partial [Verrucomicrobiae bacterium]|nr:transketolase C-terminal domain-containing protein [Verrucomicrobiae bacterium]